MSEMDERIRVSLNLEVKDPNVDLDSLDKLNKYFDEIYKSSVKVNEAMKKALDMGSVNPDTLKVYEEQINSIKKAFEKVKQIKTDAIQNAYDSFDVGGTTNISVLSDAVDKLNMKFEETADKLKKAENGFKKLQTDAKITSAAPNLTSSTDTQKQVEQVAQATNKVASVTSKSVSNSAKTCANTVNKALYTIGSVGEKVFTKIGKAGLATFKTIAMGMTNALVHPISNLKKLESVLLKPFKSLNSLLPQVSMGIRGVTSGLMTLGGIAGLAVLGKKAVDTASQLEEIQNVVDVVFAGMSDDIENFATKMAGAFGESELQAKKFTSTFGSMFSSVGIANDKILIMSENMSALAGDMASFYNIPLEQAFQKIQSGLAGEAEPLRQLGINMNQTAIEAWAMTQGITTSFDKLSTSEQTILRYNYLLAMTANAHGDFTRTQLSWANSCRQISLNVQSIFASLGNIIKAVLTPALVMINYVTSALARLLSLVGAKFKTTTQTAGSGVSDLNSKLGNTSSGLNKVADSAKKAGKAAEAAGKKAKLGLASFDQLNNLSSQKSDTGSSGGAGGGAGAGAGAGMGIDPNSYIDGIEWTDNNPLTQWLDRFYNLLADGKYAAAGEMCAKSITAGLKKVEDALDNKNLYDKIDKTNMALSNFLRGLVSDQNMWTQAGNTISSAINLIAFSINNLYENLTANNVLSSLGIGIANTINATLEKTDWSSVGSALVTGIRSGIDVAFNAIMNIDFSSLGTALKDACNGAIGRVFGEGGAAEIGGIIAGAINGAMNTVIAWLGDGTVAKNLGSSIKTAINTAINNLDAKSMGDALTAVLSSATTFLTELRGIDFNKLADKIVKGINTAIDNGSVEDFLTAAIGLLGDILSALIDAIPKIHWGKLLKALINAITKSIDEHPELGAVGIALLTAFGISKALKHIGVSKVVLKLIGKLIPKLVSSGGVIIKLIGDLIPKIISIGASIAGALGPVGLIVVAITAVIAILVILYNTNDKFRESVNNLVGGIKDKVVGFFTEAGNRITGFFTEVWGKITGFVQNIIDKIAKFFSDLAQKFKAGMDMAKAGVSAGINAIVQFFTALPGNIAGAISGFLTTVRSGFSKVPAAIKGAFRSIGNVGRNLVEGLWNGINSKVSWITSKVYEFGDKVVSGMKKFFDIHSPSRLMRDEIGVYLGMGIGVGIEDSAKYAVKSATKMGNDVMGAVADSVDPDALKFADMKLSLADVYKTDNLDTVLQHYNTQMDALVSKAQAFRDAMNEVTGKYSLDTLKVLLGDYRRVNSDDGTTTQRVIIAGQERAVAVSGMSEGVSANDVMGIINDNKRRF